MKAKRKRKRKAAGNALRALSLALCCAQGLVSACALDSEPVATRAAQPAPMQVVSRPVQKRNIDLLRQYEAERRATTDFLTLPPSNGELGPDPYRLLAAPGKEPRLVGLLRGDSELVLLDPDLAELSRVPAPRSPGALALDPAGSIYVAGELESRIAVYSLRQGQLVHARDIRLLGVLGIRDLVIARPGLGFLVEELEGRLIRAEWDPSGASPVAKLSEVTRVAGPISLQLTEHWLVVNALIEHTVLALPRKQGEPQLAGALRFTHDGPLWAVRALERRGELWVVAAGVENKPLDRTIGSFGNIDSFLFVYRAQQDVLTPVAEFNLSAEGVVTPKVLLAGWASSDTEAVPRLNVVVSGFATDTLLTLEVADSAVHVKGRNRIQPGTSAGVELGTGHLVFANPLLDGFSMLSGEQSRFRPLAQRVPAEAWRLGEALFFTTLMAPHNSAEGALSRFTCETCHFEGYVDGRVHRTGRGNVAVSTKPLLGLFNNRPHFSRALDKDLSQVAHAEFRVAGAGSGTEPWFSVDSSSVDWLKHVGVAGEVSALELRKALMAFLMRLTPRENPSVQGRAAFEPAEQRGAELFNAHCVSCHRATASTDPAAQAVPFAEWPRWIFSPNGPLVWADLSTHRTGVLPYVHESGARVPSLRRLYKKWPYLTNGSARTLDDLLRQVRLGEPRFSHGGGAGVQLSDEQRSDLVRFLRLL